MHDGVRGYAGYLLWEHLYMTLRRVLAGVVIGVALGVLIGLLDDRDAHHAGAYRSGRLQRGWPAA